MILNFNMSICIVDYHMGNLRSVKKALDRMGEESVISTDPRDIQGCDRIILPGVGHFAKRMDHLKSLGMVSALQEALWIKKNILGILPINPVVNTFK